jgi:serine protease Do
MRTILWIGTAMLAAGAITPPAQAQTVVAPRARTVTTIQNNTSYLGIGVKDIDADRAKALNMKEVRGAEVTSVQEDSPAAKAGIKEGDVVLEFNGQHVEGGEQLTRFVRETPVGRTAKIGVWRGGGMQHLTATVEARKGFQFDGGTWVMPEIRVPEIPQIEVPRFQMTYQNPALGIVGEPLAQDDQLAEFFGVKDGVLVRSVRKNSAAEKAGIKAGDVITKIDEQTVSSPREITRALQNARAKKTVTVVLMRNKKETPVTVTIESTTGSLTPGAVRALSIPARPLKLNTPMVLKLSRQGRII